MTAPHPVPASPERGGRLPAGRRFASLWPHGPLAAALGLVGALNILDGLKVPLSALQRFQGLHGLAESLSALGGTVQVLLGALLVLSGAGLLWRMVSAWALSAFVLAITVGVNAAERRWGATLALQTLLLAALVWARPHFNRRTILASFLFSLSGIVAILAYGVLGSVLLGKGFRPEILDLDTAVYFTIITLSTVGYGDIVPVTPEARWFVITLVIVGLGVFASAIASALGPKISGEFKRLLSPKEKPMQPKDHVILAGEGPIASNTATELRQRGVPFVQIVAVKAASEPQDPGVIAGDATEDGVLRLAGIADARMVIAATDDDGENAFIALGAKSLNPKVRVLAVASSAHSIQRMKLARADLVFSPAAVGSRFLADLVQGNEILPAYRDLLGGHLDDSAGK
jgi:voltage-gated potassium channel